MKFCRVFIASIAACVWLTSCGGGGGGDTSTSTNATGQAINSPSGGWLTFSPSTVDLTAYQGEPVTFSVIANSSKTIAEKINIGVIDTAGLITPTVRIVANTKTQYTATFTSNPLLPLGVHNSLLQVRICLDEPSVCKQPYTDSPWQVPIRIKVLPATNLTPLTKLDGERPWGTVNGNNSHNAYFSKLVTPDNFTRRWVKPSSQVGGGYVSPMNIANDSIISGVTSRNFIAQLSLTSLNEFDGKSTWEIASTGYVSFSIDYFSALSDGRLMVFRPYPTYDGARTTGTLGLFSAKTGQLQGQGQGGNLPFVFGLAPFFAGNSVFLGGSFGNKAEIYHYDASSGALIWRAELSAGSFGYSTPAADSRYVYAFHDPQGLSTGSVAGKLVGLDAATGAVGLNIPVSGTKSYAVFQQAPVLGANGMVFVESGADTSAMGVGNKLLAFDTTAKSLKWALNGNYRSNPVEAAGTLYVLNGQLLEARRPADGVLLWSWPVPIPIDILSIPANIIVIGNLVFLPGQRSTYAVDVSTHQSVWSYPARGEMAFSDNGILYILQSFQLVAINLR